MLRASWPLGLHDIPPSPSLSHTHTHTPSLYPHSASFKLAVEDCLDATFRVFLEETYSAFYATAPPTTDEDDDDDGDDDNEATEAEKEKEKGEEDAAQAAPQEAGQDSRPEVRACVRCAVFWVFLICFACRHVSGRALCLARHARRGGELTRLDRNAILPFTCRDPPIRSSSSSSTRPTVGRTTPPWPS